MIRAALIGLGNIAWKYDANNPSSYFALSQAGAMLRCPDVNLVCGCSPNIEDCNGFKSWSRGLAVFTNVHSMLKTIHPDLVGICSPTNKHFEHALLCMESGVRIIWLEKPPTENSHDLRYLLNISALRGCTVCVNYFRRYLPAYRNLRNCILSNTYGQCLTIRITYSPGLLRNGIHLLDQLFFLTDAKSCKILWVEKDGDCNCPSFALRLSNGSLVLGCGGDVPYHTNDISVQCEYAQLDIIRGGKKIVVAVSQENDIFKGFFDLHKTDKHLIGNFGIENYMQTVLDDLLDSAANGRPPLSNLNSALASQCLLEDILKETEK